MTPLTCQVTAELEVPVTSCGELCGGADAGLGDACNRDSRGGMEWIGVVSGAAEG